LEIDGEKKRGTDREREEEKNRRNDGKTNKREKRRK